MEILESEGGGVQNGKMGGRERDKRVRGKQTKAHLFVSLRLSDQLGDELEADVHGGDVGHHDRQQSGGVALEMNQLHHLRLRNERLCKTELHTNTPVLRHSGLTCQL